ncbi:MAG: hypothetical protein M3400_13390 [Actinomycetota bacterium]|nr:hypothetical protein [Actinomycetota bacterium]
MTVPPMTQMGSHVLHVEPAGAIALHTGGAGLIIGVDQDNKPMTIGLFRPEPTTAVAISGLALAQLLCFRSLAIGAHVLVQTPRPGAWESFVHLSAGSTGAIRQVERAGADQSGTANQPQLLLIDNDSSATTQNRPGASFATALTVHDQLTQWNAGSLTGADIVLLQGLSLAEARLAGSALGIANPERVLAGLPHDEVVLVARNSLRTSQIKETSIEQWLIGPIARRAAKGGR